MMSDPESHFELIFSRVRKQLNQERLQLWLPPFTVEGESKGRYPEELVSRFSKTLGITSPTIIGAFEHLRQHALDKLEARNRFKESGIATLKVRVAGSQIGKIDILIGLQCTGAELIKKISSEFHVDVDRLKLICNGQVINEDNTLESQSVKNSNQILVIQLSETEVEARKKQQENEKMTSQVTRTRQAAEALSKRTDVGKSEKMQYFLEINDQEGRPLNLPENERKALALAMTLHEKGKSILKHKNYAEALVYLLEADKEFSQCRAEILNAVDNYAILCLDIVWCYLCLKSINDLPDAEKRLETCQECFEKSYGRNLERLTVVRGGTGRELALLVRLHALRAVCAYHRRQYDVAMRTLDKAEQEIRKLHVDDDHLSQLVSMGFSIREARLGLRACDGDVTIAIDYITRTKQERKERTERERKERRRERMQRRLGKTADGEWVNLSRLEDLVSMGFPRQSAAEALRQSNNSMDKALQVLQDHPELLDLPPDRLGDLAFDVPDELVAQILSMGFNIEAAKEALRRFGGNGRRAIEELVAAGGVLPSSSSSSYDEQSGSSSENEDPELEKAVEELVPDITSDEHAYLDLTLEDEAAVVAEYKALLLSRGYGMKS